MQSERHVTDVFGLQGDNWYGSTVNVSVSAEHPSPERRFLAGENGGRNPIAECRGGGAERVDLLPQVQSAGPLPGEPLLLHSVAVWSSGINGGSCSQ